MGYDGALVIKIANKELLKIMKKHKETGAFDGTLLETISGSKYKGKTLAVDYEDYDCASLPRCPKKLNDITSLVLELFEIYGDMMNRDDYKALEHEIEENKELIDANYSFVDWLYGHDDFDGLGEERFHYEKGVATYTS